MDYSRTSAPPRAGNSDSQLHHPSLAPRLAPTNTSSRKNGPGANCHASFDSNDRVDPAHLLSYTY